MAAVTIRPCESADLPAVLGLLKQLAEHTHSIPGIRLERVRGLLAEMARSPEVYLNLVAEVDGQIVGFESVVFYRTLFHVGGTALISELVVDRAHRGQQIGRMLVERARVEAITRGMDELEVSTERANRAAQAFYRQAGFGEEYVLLGMEFTT